jgi:endonuclease YncB( thermonuclease family)
MRELLGTLVGLSVLLIAGLGILWATNGKLGGNTSRPGTVVHGSLPSGRSVTQPPVGVPSNAQQLTVVGTKDGDTIQVQPVDEGSPITTKASVLVRLIGIAAPAGPAIRGKAQCFAEDALKALQRLTPIGSRVWVIADAQLRDPAEHYLLYMWNSAGTFVNLALADGGYVRPDTVKPNIARRGAIEEAITAAMRAHRGLWGHCAPK